MALELNGTTGVSAVQAGAVESGDLPAGSVIQVVQNARAVRDIISSTSYQATGYEVSITPKSANNKIIVVFNSTGQVNTGGQSAYITIFKNNTVNLGGGVGDGFLQIFGADSNDIDQASTFYIDSPATTSEVTYTLYAKTNSGQIRVGRSDVLSTATAMEIAG